MPENSPEALPDVPEQALPDAQALALAQELLEQDRAFAAHEVLEASWKAAAQDDRDLWQGLAQVCVGATHLQRGNLVGAERLLRRGAGRLDRAPQVRDWALALADDVGDGRAPGGRVDAPWRPRGRPVLPADLPERGD